MGEQGGSGRAGEGGARREEEPRPVCDPQPADGGGGGAVHHEHVGEEELAERDAEVAEAAVHAEGVAGAAARVEGVDVGHRRGESAAANVTHTGNTTYGNGTATATDPAALA